MERENKSVTRKLFLKGGAAIGLLYLLGEHGTVEPKTPKNEVCPRLPVGCTIREQSGFMVRGGDPSIKPLNPGEVGCVTGPHKTEPDKYILDVWTFGEPEGGKPTEANCLIVCNRQPPLSELESICDEFRLPQGVEIYDFHEINFDPELNYKVNDRDLSLLLSENQVNPEDLKLFFFFQEDLIQAKTEEENCWAIGTMTLIGNGERRSRWIGISEFSGDIPDRFHNYRIFKTLSGLDRLNWIALHELGHAVLDYRGIDLGEGKELWFDKFADIYHDRFKIIQKED